MKEDENPKYKRGVGLDIGTMNIVVARQSLAGKVVTTRIRDAFLDLESDAKRSLKLSKVNYIEKDDTLYVIGDSALTMANLFKREARRPLSQGIIAPGELDAQEVLEILIHEVLGLATEPDEPCYYSVPADPVDRPGVDTVFHTEVFRKILKRGGHDPHPTNEALAIIYSQCSENNFSGLAVSLGSGMVNVALAYQANMGLSFALSRGGDYIDSQSGKSVGKTASQMCTIKEKGLDLAAPKTREEEAITFYVRALINYSLQNISIQFRKTASDITLPEPIPFIVSGGTSRATGFMGLFEEEFESVRKKFPIQISEIRQARDPMTAVAEGLLALATEEE
jgi:actin-like ATPase involved in cell morphogenesis